MHSGGKGISASAAPYSRTLATFVESARRFGHFGKYLVLAVGKMVRDNSGAGCGPDQLCVLFHCRDSRGGSADSAPQCKLAENGATPSQICIVLRGSHGVAQIKIVTVTSRSPTTPSPPILNVVILTTIRRILRIMKSNGTPP
jgi:hypothetical protein